MTHFWLISIHFNNNRLQAVLHCWWYISHLFLRVMLIKHIITTSSISFITNPNVTWYYQWHYLFSRESIGCTIIQHVSHSGNKYIGRFCIDREGGSEIEVKLMMNTGTPARTVVEIYCTASNCNSGRNLSTIKVGMARLYVLGPGRNYLLYFCVIQPNTRF